MERDRVLLLKSVWAEEKGWEWACVVARGRTVRERRGGVGTTVGSGEGRSAHARVCRTGRPRYAHHQRLLGSRLLGKYRGGDGGGCAAYLEKVTA